MTVMSSSSTNGHLGGNGHVNGNGNVSGNGHVNGNGHAQIHTNNPGGDDPAVIVGIGCRLPGEIRSPSKLWEVLMRKQSMQGRVPSERFNVNGFYHPDKNHMGTLDSDGGYFIKEDIRQFENTFFKINNLEAISMDPQQRKLLEVVHECFEDYGPPSRAAGSNTAVYVGNFTTDHQTNQTREPDEVHRYTPTGVGTAIMANRISHVFNLHGPSFTLDTACSASIYGLHNAVLGLKNGDCDGALVAGANLIAAPEHHVATAKGGFLSGTSTCHTFDISADGYARGEAVSAIYVKKLSSALRDGDNIRAVIRGTAINANGRTPGIAQPSSVYQEAVIRKAYKAAGLRFGDTDYVECHGTGTPVGDPIEVEAVARAFERSKESTPLRIGSVKTNLGHSEAASGLSSIIKVVLAFEKEIIPPTHGVVNINPKLQLESRNLEIVTDAVEWPRKLRRASVNSFGFGGANAHIILESASSYLSDYVGSVCAPLPAENLCDRRLVLPLSASSSKSLSDRFEGIIQYLDNHAGSYNIDELAFTLAHRRTHLDSRGFMLVEALGREVQIDPEESALITSTNTQNSPLSVSFVFTGQGAQYAGMAKELLSRNSLFTKIIRRLDKYLQSLPQETAPAWTLEQTILDSPDVSQINNVARSQPICTAVQVGLVEVLREWGLKPKATVGHSSGEIAAAYAAGFLTAKQAILVAYFRGYAVEQLRSKGAMMAVGSSVGAATDLIQQYSLEAEVCVSCVNSPESTTLSGSEHGIETLYQVLQKQKTFSRKLQTGGRAYHSFMMKDIGTLYESLLQEPLHNAVLSAADEDDLLSRRATMFSSVGTSGDQLKVFSSPKVPTMSAYWRSNLENPVQFSSALQSLVADASEGTHLIEIGPHAALKGPIDQIRKKLQLDMSQLPYSSTLRRKEDADRCLKLLAGTLFNFGHILDFTAVNGSSGTVQQTLKPVHDLPPYPWDYSNDLLWAEPRASTELRERKYPRHELLGAPELTGDGITRHWRNILQLDEVPWVRDHKVETQVVFPGAGYLGVAMQALCQTLDLDAESDKDSSPLQGAVYEFRDVNILAAFVIQEAREAGDGNPPELHTTLEPKRLSTASKSAPWFDFSISSWSHGGSTQHCTGNIRICFPEDPNEAIESNSTTTVRFGNSFDDWATGKWYEKFDEEGFCYGPAFQNVSSLRTDGNRRRAEALCKAQLIQRFKSSEDTHSGSKYSVHPITLDACFQASLFGATAGELDKLRARMPTYISKCHIRSPDSESLGDEQSIHAATWSTGPSSTLMNTTLRDAKGRPLVHMEGVHLSLYTGKASMQQGADNNTYSDGSQRSPCLRVLWRPDVLRLADDAGELLSQYIEDIVPAAPARADGVNFHPVVATLLDLIGHKNPRMRVLGLDFGDDRESEKRYTDLLGKDTAFPRCRSWTRGKLGEDGALSTSDSDNSPFDVVVVPSILESEKLGHLPQLVGDQGAIICGQSDAALQSLKTAGFTAVDTGMGYLLAVQSSSLSSLDGTQVLLLTPESPSADVTNFVSFISEYLERNFSNLRTAVTTLSALPSGIEDINKSICISLLEITQPFLATMSSEEMDSLRRITGEVKDLLWLTASNMLGVGSSDPDTTLAYGLSRALMLEHPSLRFSVLDIGNAYLPESSFADRSVTCANICRALVPQYDGDDKEFIQLDGLLHVSRFCPDTELNKTFWNRLESTRRQRSRSTTALRKVKAPLKLAISEVGGIDTLHFEEQREPSTGPPPGFADIHVKAVGLNAMDVSSLTGRGETTNGATAHEFAGVVQAVGEDVNNIALGDRVLAMAPGAFGTTIRVPAWCAQKLLDGEDFAKMATLPVAYVTALYALVDRAGLRAGETVLIHAASDAFGMAAIRIAQRLGAVVFATAVSPGKQAFMKGIGVPESNLFNTDNDSFTTELKQATKGRGVDVVVNSLAGDLLHDSWNCLANGGRFVEVGKRELVDAGKLDMRMFLRNTTFTAVDMSDLYLYEDAYYQVTLAKKLKEALDLYRSGEIEAPPHASFDGSEVSQAFHSFSSKDCLGKVVVTLDDLDRKYPIKPSKYTTIFDSTKSYLLVGCLGGLGRSLSRWMLARGARKFVFLGRTGCDKPSAKRLVSGLESGAEDVTVKVIRGDVSNAADVTAAVKAAQDIGHGGVGGVVQAAMGLHEALFQTMPNEAWHTGIRPKWTGTWNLHNALEGRDSQLDFFLLTSSVSGSVGTATESNYCAANNFLDSFAKWRRQQRKPAISIGLGMISEVGYLHENPEIEELLLRKGIQPLKEAEFLQVVDLGISEDFSFADRLRSYESDTDKPNLNGTGKLARDRDAAAGAHILTGLEPSRIRELISRGFDVDNQALQDPRARLLSVALFAEQEKTEAAQGSLSGLDVNAIPWLKPLPGSVAKALLPEAAEAGSLQAATLQVIRRRFSNLVMIPLDQLDSQKTLPHFGMDSMIAADFRTWFWKVFKVDVPFLDLLSPTKNLGDLAAMVEEEITKDGS